MKYVLIILTFLMINTLNAQNFTMKVWSGGAPDSNGIILLLYPVISFSEEFVHMGSRRNLIGEGNGWKMVNQYSSELQVTSETPPAFLILADDDKSVVPRNSIEFYSDVKAYNVPAEMHIFQKGGHGFGMRGNNIPADNWPNLFMDWLKTTGF